MREVTVTLGDCVKFATLYSVGQKEYFAAAQQSLKPSHVFRIRACEYNDENRLTYEGKAYAIYRTYVEGDWIELYTTEKAGVR